MPVYRLSNELAFPPPELADVSGMLAVGGDLSPERLLLAYSQGIFPWPIDDLPLPWFSPDPRWTLEPRSLRCPRRLERTMRNTSIVVRLDTRFDAVIRGCARAPRRGQDGTWITPAMIEAYEHLALLGYAHCAEAWQGSDLVGGVYGVSLGACFFGESMFTRAPDASKIALVMLLQQLAAWDFQIFDCQTHSSHVERLGAAAWPRERFLRRLAAALQAPTRRGPWRFDPGLSTPGLRRRPAMPPDGE